MTNLSEKELFFIALRELQDGQHGPGMTHLKELLEINPDNVDGHFLLGAEYAQLAMYDEAVNHLSTALDLQPSLNIARFQLGLVNLAVGEFQNVRTTLEPILVSCEGQYLEKFAKGILFCIENKSEEAITSIREGIVSNNENPSLNKDMEGVITAIENLPEQQTTGEAQMLPEREEQQSLESSDYLLGAYRN